MKNKAKGINDLLKDDNFFHGHIESLTNIKEFINQKSISEFFSIARLNKVKNVKLSAFKNGQHCEEVDLVKFSEEMTADNIYNKLLQLPCSARITNIQLLNDDLKKICLSLYKKTGFPVTVNMYITPGSGKNCFLYHADPQETLVYQVTGKKKWFIPIDENNKKIIVNSVESPEKIEGKDAFKFDIDPEDFLFLPHCMLHKAEAYEELSIHISFAFLTYFKTQFQLFLEDEISTALDLKATHYDKLDNIKLSEWMDQFRAYFNSMNNEEVIRKVKARINSEEIRILKMGRPYHSESDLDDVDK